MAAICKLSQNYIATVVDDEVLIVDLDGGELFSLAGSARAIWEAIDDRRDEHAIADLMAHRFAGGPDTIRADVFALVNALEKASLVERSGEAF